ncbi:MAG: hypothetical protein A7316_00760 [Candidatus Altiarchaeales archaeon WOR_SM1_86-2]|nr:MAG: hypothetical protein A7316_00760 [Candidatus Altiarchaeales archaeon WOR_SM1_86-2]ODS41706.1 MAG: hypothetical protein A7315_00525 [Candidatus Altiarchaeales archaeon WOR_SM1_79]
MKVKRALISVSDKTKIWGFAKKLNELGIEILSTSGTAKVLKKIPVKDVSDFTGFPEILDGRVKTLNPKIHGGILNIRNKEYKEQMDEHGIENIDLVVVNLYPHDVEIDVGGAAVIMGAAKNYPYVTVVVDPGDYDLVTQELKNNECETMPETRKMLALKAFDYIADYNAAIYNYLKEKWK